MLPAVLTFDGCLVVLRRRPFDAIFFLRGAIFVVVDHPRSGIAAGVRRSMFVALLQYPTRAKICRCRRSCRLDNSELEPGVCSRAVAVPSRRNRKLSWQIR